LGNIKNSKKEKAHINTPINPFIEIKTMNLLYITKTKGYESKKSLSEILVKTNEIGPSYPAKNFLEDWEDIRNDSLLPW
jgi:hypothetical protein